ncbi:MAG: MBL fold metallo-hydrolase [Sumerlaeia bacterium]
MRMRVIVTGSGTSTGVPPIGCEAPVCLSGDPRNKRLRSGLYFQELGGQSSPHAPGEHPLAFIVDCSPDYRQQALTHKINRIDGVLLTHSHFDHVAGLDDLRIYNFRQKHALPLYGPAWTLDDVRRRCDYFFNPPQEGGGVASFDLRPVDPAVPFVFLDRLAVEPVPVKHGIADVFGYRFGDFAHITDASEIPASSLERLRGCRVLILNALRSRPHSTHLSLDEAVEVARDLAPEQTYFVHMNHELDHEETNAKLPRGMALAYDGLAFEIEAREATAE